MRVRWKIILVLLVVATFVAPPANPAKTNRDEHLATLSFVLPHLPE